ncbi:VanZ family protein [Methanolobus sp. ZRKC3]|uniref:VanZ family protein n=1 Tax=Methanolobus sp. ZRKC3 TaxID=3125786 RepID=UPI00324A0B33
MQKLLKLVHFIVNYDYRNNKSRIFLLLTLLYAAMIFYLSSRSDISIPASMLEMPLLHTIKDFLESSGLYFAVDLVEYSYYHRDKIAHMFLYFGLGLLLHLTFGNSGNTFLRKYAAVFAVVLGVIYGITDEIHQSYVPGRTASVHDLLADGIGVTIAQLVFILFVLKSLQNRKEKKRKEKKRLDKAASHYLF